MSEKKREQLSTAELETFNTSAERVCRGFDVFYNYMIENHTKISVRTGNIGKKDCFKINQLLSWKEEYEKEGYMQDQPDFKAIENYEDMMSLLEFCAASEPSSDLLGTGG